MGAGQILVFGPLLAEEQRLAQPQVVDPSWDAPRSIRSMVAEFPPLTMGSSFPAASPARRARSASSDSFSVSGWIKEKQVRLVPRPYSSAPGSLSTRSAVRSSSS